ncbi:BspA family leucine-rich repeat surface protein [Gelidibacter sp.]|uniref:BspA family leucine-rich repeat surface protein n=1 Tax=Gelidibacter sp. TaxID=2018083 RepID=UPI002B9360C3|nr:BspA family leucine-rich repeat surface protein [Gelidibacter sp.]HUH27947.1 BspA family leucine-rich repeat surface protein [Gelidibacter sp.]
MKKNLLLLTLFFIALQVRAQNEFITTWKTDNPGSSNSTSIIIPTYSGETYNYDVDWNNDGNWETGFTATATHDYGTAGVYTVAIRGNFPRIYFANVRDRRKLLTVEQWGSNPWTSMGWAFTGCSNLVINAVDAPDLSGVTDMSSMFSYATDFNSDIGHWDVSTVTDMSRMFEKAKAFNQDLGLWDVGNVTNMNWMFQEATAFNQDLNNWNVGKVSNMFRMFEKASAFNGNIGNWNVGNVTNMSRMFEYALAFNQDLNNWNVGKVTDMSGMFAYASVFNGNIGNWDVSNVTDMSTMFGHAPVFNHDIGNWDVGNVTTMLRMFEFAFEFNQHLDNWDVSKVTNMRIMFANCYAFNGRIGSWDVRNVNDMSLMFSDAFEFNQDISNWDVGKVTNMSAMFSANNYVGIPKFNQDIGNWNVSNVTMMDWMFYGAAAFNQDIGRWDVGNVRFMQYMFRDSIFNYDIGNWDVGKVTDMNRMFWGARFDQNIGNWNVSNVYDMGEMFMESGLSTPNYDALLNGWSRLILQDDVAFDAGYSTFCAGGAAKAYIMSNFSWYIKDEGPTANCSGNDYFVTTWKTDNPGASNARSITIPTFGSGYNYDVDWNNNGNWETGLTGNVTHTYATPGTYTVAIRGSFPRIYFNNEGDRQKLLSIDQWGSNAWRSMGMAFYGCSNLMSNATDYPNLLLVTDMSGMFDGATVLGASSADRGYGSNRSSATVGGMGNWNVRNVTDMSRMFRNVTTFDWNIGHWNVSNVTDMTDMFEGVTMSTSNYDALLNGWNSLSLQNNVIFSGGQSTYNEGEAARANMVNSFGWTITDGGLSGSLSIDDVSLNLESVRLFPNPATSTFTIDNQGDQVLRGFDIYDITGRVVKSVKLHHQPTREIIDISNLATATYIIKINSDKGSVIKKLVVN